MTIHACHDRIAACACGPRSEAARSRLARVPAADSGGGTLSDMSTASSQSRLDAELRAAGIVPTRQRRFLLHILRRSGSVHFSAEWLYHRAVEDSAKSKTAKSIAFATVYNTLKIFRSSGLIKEIRLDNGRKFFDTNTKPHHHLYNADTGKLADIPLAPMPVLSSVPKGYRVESVDLLIRIRKNESP